MQAIQAETEIATDTYSLNVHHKIDHHAFLTFLVRIEEGLGTRLASD